MKAPFCLLQGAERCRPLTSVFSAAAAAAATCRSVSRCVDSRASAAEAASPCREHKQAHTHKHVTAYTCTTPYQQQPRAQHQTLLPWALSRQKTHQQTRMLSDVCATYTHTCSSMSRCAAAATWPSTFSRSAAASSTRSSQPLMASGRAPAATCCRSFWRVRASCASAVIACWRLCWAASCACGAQQPKTQTNAECNVCVAHHLQ